MQANYQIMPKRNGKTDGSFKKLPTIKFFTNYYDISLNSNKSKIYQYSFSLPEQIPQDSALYNKAIFSIKKDLRQKIGYIAHSGQMIWGTEALKVPTTLQCKFDSEENKFSLQSVIKLTKQLNMKDLDQEKTRQVYIQILNVNLKNMLKALKLVQLGKPGQFFQSKTDGNQQLDEKGLQVLKGFRFTLTPLTSGIYLQVDVCSRVLQSRNLLQTFNGKGEKNKQIFIGSTVITKYGTFRTYKIEDIDHSKSPLTKFHNDKKGVQMSYVDYYKEVYGINIRNTKQPLLLAIKSIKKQLDKGGKKTIEKKQYVYLVPELVSATGMTDDQRSNHTTMKALAPFTKLSPTERVRQCEKIVEKLNDESGLIQIKNAKRMDGQVLPRPELIYSGGIVNPDNRGNIRYRGVLRQPFFFTDWVFVYSQSQNAKRDDQQADDAVKLLKKSGQSYGVKFKQPGFISVRNGSVQDWKEQIRADVEKSGAPQIVVLLLNQYQQKFYGELKRFITNQLKCPSQFIRRRTLNNQKGAMSAASKIVIQMNVKVGSVPWEVQKKHDYFKGRNIMYGALSISKGAKGNTLAFVGTINSQCTKVFSDCKVGIKDKQNIPTQLLHDIFVSWAKTYYQTNNKKVPDLILLYRQGLSIPQTKDQLPRMEIPALQSMIEQIGTKTKTNNYRPQVMIVTVNKKINSRYFSVGKENPQNPNKFVPELFNVDSGSIMVEPFSTDDSYDFHLSAQYVTQGTCTPTLFRVAYDTTKMPQQALINFTFEQCFNYYNWEGAVRVPACLQCADKLSKLVSMSVKQSIVQSPVTKKHFFL